PRRREPDHLHHARRRPDPHPAGSVGRPGIPGPSVRAQWRPRRCRCRVPPGLGPERGPRVPAGARGCNHQPLAPPDRAADGHVLQRLPEEQPEPATPVADGRRMWKVVNNGHESNDTVRQTSELVEREDMMFHAAKRVVLATLLILIVALSIWAPVAAGNP